MLQLLGSTGIPFANAYIPPQGHAMRTGTSLPAPISRADPEQMAQPAVRMEPEFMFVLHSGQETDQTWSSHCFQGLLMHCPKHSLDMKAGEGADALSPPLHHWPHSTVV